MTNLKPFNLERALAGDPVVTQHGKKVLELHYFKTCNDSHRLFTVIEEYNFLTTYDDNGKFFSIGNPSRFDLFMAPKSQKYYVSIFFDDSAKRIRCGKAELSISVAEGHKKSYYKLLQTIEFEIEEE